MSASSSRIEVIELTAGQGIPCGPAITYLCLKCRTTVPSNPDEPTSWA